ncbi:MAG: hypothetical protein K2V38_19290, partial [Gemmataceae bacterium]|nr:hypothetical protein [Gemmataceae bacterium]
VEARVLALVNAARAQPRRCGKELFVAVPPLQHQSLLTEVAAGHAADMAQHSYFSHTARDGSTGVRVTTNVTGAWQSQTYGDAANPVTNVSLDMRDGNDVVSVASLKAAVVFVGAGSGNNFVSLGETKSGGVIVGSGRNVLLIGGGTTPLFGSSTFGDLRAGSAAFVGWGYQFTNGGRDIFTSGSPVGNTNANVILMDTRAGQSSLVDLQGSGNNLVLGGRGADWVNIAGNGNNWVCAGSGDDRVVVNGGGNNTVSAGSGNNTVNVTGNGNNTVRTDGAGSVTVNGSGRNSVRAGRNATAVIALNGAGVGSTITAPTAASVFVNGTAVTASGTVGNVQVTLF